MTGSPHALTLSVCGLRYICIILYGLYDSEWHRLPHPDHIIMAVFTSSI